MKLWRSSSNPSVVPELALFTLNRRDGQRLTYLMAKSELPKGLTVYQEKKTGWRHLAIYLPFLFSTVGLFLDAPVYYFLAVGLAQVLVTDWQLRYFQPRGASFVALNRKVKRSKATLVFRLEDRRKWLEDINYLSLTEDEDYWKERVEEGMAKALEDLDGGVFQLDKLDVLQQVMLETEIRNLILETDSPRLAVGHA